MYLSFRPSPPAHHDQEKKIFIQKTGEVLQKNGRSTKQQSHEKKKFRANVFFQDVTRT